MLKVAFNATALLAPLTGIGQYAWHLASGFKSQPDLDVGLFYGNGFSREVLKAPASEQTAKARVWVRRWVPHAYGIKRALHQRQFDAGQRKAPYDLYHEPNALALKFDGPTVITVHDLSWIRYPGTHPAERVRAMDRYFEPALRKASLLITDSVFVKNEIVEVFGIDPSAILPIPLGLDPLFKPMGAAQTHAVLAPHGLAHGQYFLSVGTLEPRKNMPATIAAYASLPQALRSRYPLVLAGMKGWRTTALESLLKPLVQTGQVRMLGYLERSELAVVTAAARAMIYPSLYEGFGLPPLESMGCAVPPITSNVSSLPEVVGEAGIVVDPHDIDALANAMLALASDDVLRATLSVKALARSARFTWDRCVAQTVAAYRLAATTSR